MIDVKVKRHKTGDLYIDVPVNMFEEMGWNSNTKLMWIVDESGNVCIRPPKHDTEPGLPVEFIDLLKDKDNNDSSTEA